MAKMLTLFDNFYSTSLDTAKWDASNSGATIGYTESGLELRFRSATVSGDYAKLQSDVAYDLTDSSALIKIESLPTGTSSTIKSIFRLYTDASNYVAIEWYVNSTSTTVKRRMMQAGVESATDVTDIPSATCWLKISHSSTNPTLLSYGFGTSSTSFAKTLSAVYSPIKTSFYPQILISASGSATDPGTLLVSRFNGKTQYGYPDSKSTTIVVPTDLYFTRGPGALVDSIASTLMFGDTVAQWDQTGIGVDSINGSTVVGSPGFINSPASATLYSNQTKPRTIYGSDVV